LCVYSEISQALDCGCNLSEAALTQLPALLPAQIDMFPYRIRMSPAGAETQVSFTSLLTGMQKPARNCYCPVTGNLRKLIELQLCH